METNKIQKSTAYTAAGIIQYVPDAVVTKSIVEKSRAGMKSGATSPIHHTYTGFKLNQTNTSKPGDLTNSIDAARQYYINPVLKTAGIPNTPSVQKPLSPSKREQRAFAFKERNKSLKFYIGLIHQAAIEGQGSM